MILNYEMIILQTIYIVKIERNERTDKWFN